jgi:heme exporter protein C
MRKNWWKALTVIILTYVLFAGLMNPVPKLPILHEAIRNTFFHPPLWIAMMVMLLASAGFSIRYLSKGRLEDDLISVEFANTAILFGILGCITGSVWAYFAWGDLWPNDPKTNGVAIGMLTYFAYFILRSSFDDELRRARISSIYNIFAFAVFIPLILILPRLTDSLHPVTVGIPVSISTMPTVPSKKSFGRLLSDSLYWAFGLPNSGSGYAGWKLSWTKRKKRRKNR